MNRHRNKIRTLNSWNPRGRIN